MNQRYVYTPNILNALVEFYHYGVRVKSCFWFSAWLFFFCIYNIKVIYSMYSIFYVEGHLRCGEGAVWGGLWGEQRQSFWLPKHRKQQQCHHSRGQEREVDAKRYCALHTRSLLTVSTSLHPLSLFWVFQESSFIIAWRHKYLIQMLK